MHGEARVHPLHISLPREAQTVTPASPNATGICNVNHQYWRWRRAVRSGSYVVVVGRRGGGGLYKFSPWDLGLWKPEILGLNMVATCVIYCPGRCNTYWRGNSSRSHRRLNQSGKPYLESSVRRSEQITYLYTQRTLGIVTHLIPGDIRNVRR